MKNKNRMKRRRRRERNVIEKMIAIDDRERDDKERW